MLHSRQTALASVFGGLIEIALAERRRGWPGRHPRRTLIPPKYWGRGAQQGREGFTVIIALTRGALCTGAAFGATLAAAGFPFSGSPSSSVSCDDFERDGCGTLRRGIERLQAALTRRAWSVVFERSGGNAGGGLILVRK